MMMLIPEAWAGNPLMDEERRAFYEYHAALMEPWDGPAAVAFTDGRQIGATLDRNGLRPARLLRHQRRPASSWPPRSACCRSPEESIVQKWRLQPGKMLLVDLERRPHHRRRRDQGRACRPRSPIGEWLGRTQIELEDLRRAGHAASAPTDPARSPAGVRLHPGRPAAPHGADGHRPGRSRSARWAPTRRSAVLSDRPKLLFTTTSSRTSRRSPTRRSIRSARNW